MGRYLLVVLLCAFSLACGGVVETSISDMDEEAHGETDGDTRSMDGVAALPDATGTPAPDCSGQFGPAAVVFEDPGWTSQALSPTSSGLEFYYARMAVDRSLDDSGTRLPTLRTRPTLDAEFGEPTTLYHLATACEEARPGTELATLDISHDGKRLYLGCSTFIRAAGSRGPLLMFERADTNASFELPPTNVGEAGISLGLTRDELTAFGTSLEPSIDEVVYYERSSLLQPFGEARVVSGSITLGNPEPSPDGRELWGSVDLPDSTRNQLAVAQYDPDTESLQPPTTTTFVPPVGFSDISPALSADCRTLYFSRYTGYPNATSLVMAARR